jgi:hypothetical protein
MEGVVAGGPGEAAHEAAVLNVRRRHLFFHTPTTNLVTKPRTGGGGEANPPRRAHEAGEHAGGLTL